MDRNSGRWKMAEADKPKIGQNRGNAGKGRPKGMPNKLNGQLKEMILNALAEAGGVEYLVQQSEKNPKAFLTLVGKVLPLQLGGDPNNPLIHEIRRTIVSP